MSFYSVYNSPDVKVFYNNNDNWSETMGYGSVLNYDQTKSIGDIDVALLAGEHVSTYTSDLDIASFLADDNDIYSLILQNIDSSKYSRNSFVSSASFAQS